MAIGLICAKLPDGQQCAVARLMCYELHSDRRFDAWGYLPNGVTDLFRGGDVVGHMYLVGYLKDRELQGAFAECGVCVDYDVLYHDKQATMPNGNWFGTFESHESLRDVRFFQDPTGAWRMRKTNGFLS